MGALQQLGYFEGIELTDDMFMQDTLNDLFLTKTWRLVRNRLAELFDETNPTLRDNKNHREVVIFKVEDIEMLLPFKLEITPIFTVQKSTLQT